MDISQKYELIETLPGEGPRSFRARRSGLGRDVTVHILAVGQTAENQVLMARLRALPANFQARIVEVGTDNEGAQYIVTAAPPFQHLVEWLKEQEQAAMEAQKLTRAGVWKIPVGPPPASPPPAPPPPTPPAEADAFADMFREPQPMPTGQMMAVPSPPQPSAPPAESQPGEFTRLFLASTAPAAAPASQPSPP